MSLTVSEDEIRARVRAAGGTPVIAGIKDNRGRTVRPGARCGTDKGYYDHKRRQEETCLSCRGAHARAEGLRKKRKEEQERQVALNHLICPCASCRADALRLLREGAALA